MTSNNGPQTATQAQEKPPTPAQLMREFMQETIEELLGLKFKRLQGQVRVIYRPRCPYHFAARRSQKYGIILICSLKLQDKQFLKKIDRAAYACLDIHRGTTRAVIVRQQREKANG